MRFKLVLAALLMAFAIAGPGLEHAEAFQGEGCGAECMDCHSLTKAEAGKLLKTEKFKAWVSDIRLSHVKGLWEVEIRQGDNRFKVYMDFA